MMATEHLTITSWEQYHEYRDGIQAFELWRDGRTSYRTEDIPATLRWVTNEVRSAVEHWAFKNHRFDRYFAYVAYSGRAEMIKPIRIQSQVYEVTTWTGQPLGNAWLGKPYRDNFGGTRQSITVHAINGAKYHGTYYKSSGDFCRLTRSKAVSHA